MATVRERTAPNSDIVYHVGHILPWLAAAPGQNDLSWIQSPNLERAIDPRIEEAVIGLARNSRERRESVTTTISRMTEKLKTEVESVEPGTIMDPDGTATQALEQAEEYFRNECEELDRLHSALKALRSAAVDDSGVFDELDKLRLLFTEIISWAQEIRWLMLINDGTLAPTTGKTFESGADLIAALDDSS